jgi:hypothetical protein
VKPADEWRSRRMMQFKKLLDRCTREMVDAKAHLADFESALEAQNQIGPFQMKLTALAQVRTGAPRADFWLQRRGTDQNVGKPTQSPQWSQYNIGITVKRTDIVDPRYLYYWFELLWMKGYWQRLNYGTLPLRHIRTEDVCRLVVTFDP